MAIYTHYIDNVSGATGNGGTGPADAHYNFQQAIDGISAGAYTLDDLAVIYVKGTGVTYEEEGVVNFPNVRLKFIGTNSSFEQDGTKPVISNSTDYFMRDLTNFSNRIYFTNFEFRGGYSIFKQGGYWGMSRCDFYSEGGSYVMQGDEDGFKPTINGTAVNCNFYDWNTIHYSGSNRGAWDFIYCYMKNSEPHRQGGSSGFTWLVNCILDNSIVRRTRYTTYHIINCLFYNSEMQTGDRTTSDTASVIVNNAFIDASGYAFTSLSVEDAETYLFDSNIFDGAVSGNFDIGNNFDPALYFGITASSGNPTFVDEATGGTAGFQPTNNSTMSKISMFNNDIGPIRSADPVAVQLSAATADFDSSLALNSTITFEGSGKRWRLASKPKNGITVFRRA